jgi:predicted permease
MTALRYFFNRLRALWRPDDIHDEISEEMRFHIELRAEENVRRGMTPEEARRKAEQQFGRLDRIKEEGYDVRGGRWLEATWQDLRYGARMLLKSKMFTLVTVLSLALAIGANTAIFSLLDAVLLRSLPVREPEKLVFFGRGISGAAYNDFPNKSWGTFSYPFYREARRLNEVFSDVAATQIISSTVHGAVNTNGASGEMAQIEVQLVSGSYFPTLGVNASLGRVITDADDQVPGAHPVAVVSYDWWERWLGGDPAAVGKTVTIDKVAYTVIGVAPKEFFGTAVLEKPDMWIPLAMEAQMPPTHWNFREDWTFQSNYLIARLKNGVSAEQASVAVNLLFKQFLQGWAGAQPSVDRSQDILRAKIELTPGGKGFSYFRLRFSLSLRILMAVVGVVLLIACANVANLLLARAAARHKEFAIRLAVGAGRTRLMRQLLTESLLLSGLGAVAGIVLASWGLRMILLIASAGPEALPLDITPNARALGFTTVTSLLSALIFGTAPALRASRIEPNSSLKSGKGDAQGASQSRFGKALVVAQVALSLLLLVGAGLFVRTLINLRSLPSGYDQENVLLIRTDISATGYAGVQGGAILREVEEKVKAVPGVKAASFSLFVFNQGIWPTTIFTRDYKPPERESPVIRNNVVGQDYFTTMGIPLLEGRVFGPQDTNQVRPVAVISETLARRFFPDGSPLGKRFGIGLGLERPKNSEQFEIIGVVKDSKYMHLAEPPEPNAYYSHAQIPSLVNNLVVRYSGSPDAVIPQVRRAILEVNRNLPIDEVVSLSDHIGRSLAQQKLVARVASFFGLLALLLACVGLYGVLSYAVARRTNEIGIRIALGAMRGDVIWLVLREALTLVGAGAVIGLLASLAATRTVSTLLFGLKPNDPLTIAAATLPLLAIAVLSAYLPARRASRVDPMAALREE